MTNEQFLLTTFVSERMTESSYEGTIQDYFELFSAEQILKAYDLTYDELSRGIVDGGDDGKIDSIYTIINKELIEDDTELVLRRDSVIELHIIQSKYTGGFSEDVVNVLGQNLCQLLHLSTDLKDLRILFSKNVLAKIGIFRDSYKKLLTKFPRLSINIYYCTYSEDVHPKAERRADQLKENIRSLFSDASVNFNFIGAKKMLELARAIPTSSFGLDLVENPITTARGGYVCLVSLESYAKFITDEKGEIRRAFFEANVRDYQGEVPVNEDIRGTLDTEGGEDFWWLNNGVTILCSDVSYSGKILVIQNPEIVNGLQTSTVIFLKYRGSVPTSEKRNLLVRVVKPEKDASRDKIIKATNNQTKMPPSSLRATDAIHRNIEEYLKTTGLYYDRRKNHYKNLGKPPAKIISLPFLAQCVMAILLQRPNDARARPSSVLNIEADYKLIFSASYPLALYSVCVQIIRRVEDFLRLKTSTIDYTDRNNLKFYIAFLASLELCKTTTPKAENISSLTSTQIDTLKLDELYKLTYDVYVELGANDSAAKGKDLIARIGNYNPNPPTRAA